MGLTRIADSSFLIACFDTDDPRSDEAFRALQDPVAIFVPAEVLGETLGVVQRRKGTKAARLILSNLKQIAHLRLMTEVDHEGTAAVYEASTRLSWVDAAVVHWCRAKNAVPLAYDPDIERQGKDR